ncbi:hypothetical protein BGX38DRAFT_1204837 [Terfezia claveryi]|nr:hypothetical protein BGX38DRAFT_1204837 [Terfezia claveryi]
MRSHTYTTCEMAILMKNPVDWDRQNRLDTETWNSVIRGEAGRPVRVLDSVSRYACNWRNVVVPGISHSPGYLIPRISISIILSDYSRLRAKLYRTSKPIRSTFDTIWIPNIFPQMKVPAHSTLVAFVALATPTTAGLLSCLLPFGLGDFTLYTPLLDHIPAAVMGLKTIIAFPACAHNCLVTVACNCGMVDYGCRCKDPLHIFAQSLCVVENCPNDRDQAIAYNTWAKTCAPYLGITIEK